MEKTSGFSFEMTCCCLCVTVNEDTLGGSISVRWWWLGLVEPEYIESSQVDFVRRPDVTEQISNVSWGGSLLSANDRLGWGHTLDSSHHSHPHSHSLTPMISWEWPVNLVLYACWQREETWEPVEEPIRLVEEENHTQREHQFGSWTCDLDLRQEH